MHLNCVQLPASYLFYYKYYVGGLGINIHTYIHGFNSLIFQHYVKCDTTRPKCRNWRNRRTGKNLDLAPFNGSQSCLLFSIH